MELFGDGPGEMVFLATNRFLLRNQEPVSHDELTTEESMVALVNMEMSKIARLPDLLLDPDDPGLLLWDVSALLDSDHRKFFLLVAAFDNSRISSADEIAAALLAPIFIVEAEYSRADPTIRKDLPFCGLPNFTLFSVCARFEQPYTYFGEIVTKLGKAILDDPVLRDSARRAYQRLKGLRPTIT